MANKLEVGPAEAGQSILRFLERRLNCPKASIYRWLRSGEIRVNGGRGKPDRVLAAGDLVRVPPQAGDENGPALSACMIGQAALGQNLRIIFQDNEILVLDKPRGLPVHGGTRHKDSLAGRIKAACLADCGEGAYVPAPAHRLDLQASGLILAGKTHASQVRLHALFRESKIELEREYLCWVRGNAVATFTEALLCVDFLSEERDAKGRERAAVVSEGGKEARAWYNCLEVRNDAKFGTVSLMRAKLLTGRKHQIRVQLAARGFPLLGDWRYGGSRQIPMMLHAGRVALPAPNARIFISVPDWTGIFTVGEEHVQAAAS